MLFGMKNELNWYLITTTQMVEEWVNDCMYDDNLCIRRK